MSAASTPAPTSRYVSPSPGYSFSSPASYIPGVGSPPLPANSPKPSSSKAKPANVFSNDGSFLERFQRTKREEEEKKKEDALTRKRTFDQRFKNRGKRGSPDASSISTNTADEPAVKKVKSDKPMTEYEREVKSYSASLKDNGIGVRPLVK